jgi:putative ABC transport system permease protein
MRKLVRPFIALVSRLAPGAARREFRAEWDAELATDPSLARALGALPDAWCLFRQQWSLDMLSQDIRYGVRLLARRPAYTAIVVLTLAIGIGATTAVFSVINGVLLRPLPYPDDARLAVVWENDRLNLKPRYPVAPANYDDWRTGTHAFQHLAAYVEGGGRLSPAGADAFHVNVTAATTNFFDTLQVRPLLGRTFTAEESVPPRHRVLVLAYRTWQSRFASDPEVIGRTIQLNEVPYRIIGVMPRGFAFPTRDVDGWRAMAITPDFLKTRAQHFLTVIGRLQPAATLDDGRRDLESIAQAAQRAHPDTNDQRGTTLASLADAIEGDVRQPMYLIFAAVALLLLIGVVNVANLMLVEAAARRREMALRSALGADRLRIVRQLVVEGLLLAAIGGGLGLALAAAGTRGLGRVAADYVPRLHEVAIDWRVLAFAAAASIAAGVCFALAPALAASRTNVQHDLRDGGRGTVGGSRGLRGLLVFVEFAAAVVLVIGAGLVLKSFWRLVNVAPGFSTTSVLTADIGLPSRYRDDPVINQFYDDFLARVRAIPGVAAAGVVNNLPVSGNGWTAWLTIENAPRPSGEPPEVGYRTASAGYFAAMQIPILEGRGIGDGDTAAAPKVVVINRALADRFFPGGRAVGTRVRLGPNPKAPWWTIVGIAGNVRHIGPETEPTPEAFMPAAQEVNDDLTLAVRMSGNPDAIARAVRDASRSVDPAVTLWRMRTVADVMDEHLAPRRLAMWLIAGFGAIALALALLGIYGVMSCTVSERVPEIGVRLALGANPAGILRMVVRDGMRLAIPGLMAGAVAAAAVTRVARALLFDVSPTDPATFAAVAASITVVALLACYLPARRASRVDPLVAIRAE